MKAKTLDLGLVFITLAVLIFTDVRSAFAQGTAFTYQGRLQEGAIPANGSYVEIIEWLVATGRLDHFEEETADFELAPGRQDALRLALFAYFEKAAQPAKALALVEAHPAIVQPSFAVRLRKLAVAAHDFERGGKLLEKLAAQSNPPDAYSLELARLHGDWAQAQSAAGQADSALVHLRLANEGHPELFDIATRLSALLQSRGDHKGAIETLESFLAVAKVPAEIEQARAQLAKLRSGG